MGGLNAFLLSHKFFRALIHTHESFISLQILVLSGASVWNYIYCSRAMTSDRSP